jgi:transcriptional antiterminator RfaH
MNAISQINAMDERWFILCTEPRREGTAMGHLIGRGMRAFMPTELHTRNAGRRVTKVALPMFPGYLFVRIAIRAGLFMRVETVPGIMRFLRVGERYATVDEVAIDELRFHMLCGLDTRPECTEKELAKSDREKLRKPFVPMVKQQAKLVTGPFGGLVATITSVDPKGRISLLLDLFGRETKINVDADEIAAA